MDYSGKNYWALVLGGSSGFGLATAQKLASLGMNICIVHRDRKSAMQKVEPEFEQIRKTGVSFLAFNQDALAEGASKEIISELKGKLGGGKVRLLLHSIAFGNLKLLVRQKTPTSESAAAKLAAKLGIDESKVQSAVDELFDGGEDALAGAASPAAYEQELFLEDEDIANTIFAMGTSMVTWVQQLHSNDLFADDARVLGLTSEGNEVAWRGYAAVSAAKVALEAVSRNIAMEFAPFGIRCNIVQPGVTDTPALRLIPGSRHLIASARSRNPFGRLTTPKDVANLISLLCSDEAGWINGSIMRVDGGEHISG